MTQATAQTVVSALIGLGYTVGMKWTSDGDVIIVIDFASVPALAVAAFAAAQGVTATVRSVDLS